MTNFEYYIKGGRNNEGWGAFVNVESNCKGRTTIDRYNNWLLKEHEEPILDDVEKEYLSNVIKPFRNRVFYICKVDEGKRFYMEITLDNGTDFIFLPYFKSSSKMYKNMKLNHKYTLEELGL